MNDLHSYKETAQVILSCVDEDVGLYLTGKLVQTILSLEDPDVKKETFELLEFKQLRDKYKDKAALMNVDNPESKDEWLDRVAPHKEYLLHFLKIHNLDGIK